MANAQLGLPDQIATAPALSAEQQESIRTFVKANAAGLSAPEASNIRRARSALIAPLRVPHASVEFRTRYADALDPVLKPLVSNARDEVVINALSIAGETGTRRAGVELLDLALGDKRPAVRMTAVLGYKNALFAAREQPELGTAYAMGIVESLHRLLPTEKDPLVLDGAAAALDAATRTDPSKIEGVQTRAAEVLAKGVGALVRDAAAGSILTGAGIRAGKSLFDLLSNPNINLPPPVLIACGGFAGDVLASVRRRLSGATPAPLDEADRGQLGLAVAQAERVYFLAHQRLGVGTPLSTRLADGLTAGNDDQFKAESGKFIDTGGVLSQPPFALDAGLWLIKN